MGNGTLVRCGGGLVRRTLGDMSALSVYPVAGATAATATATAATTTGAVNHHDRHLVGNALRLLRVMAGAAFEVVILGRVEEERVRRPVS